MTEKQIRETFRYHSPGPLRVRAHEEIREAIIETVVSVAAVSYTHLTLPTILLV